MSRLAAYLSIALMVLPLGAAQRRSKKKRPAKPSTYARKSTPVRPAPVSATVHQTAVAYVTAHTRGESDRAVGVLQNAAGLVPFFEQID